MAVLVLLVLALTGSPAPEEDLGAPPTTTPDSDSSEATLPEGADNEIPTALGPGPFGEPAPIPVTAVIVDNVPGVGFQVGIDAAALLIEVPVEGGLTRFTALYGEQTPDLVGPVRSLRPVSADLLAPFRPVVFNTGGQRFVVGAVEGTGTTTITPGESIAFQTLERPQPYHLFVSPGVEVVTAEPVESPWDYGDWLGGEPATEVTVPIGGGITWRFEGGVYVRYQDGEAFEVLSALDTDPVPLTRDTLILLVAHQKSAGYTDSAGAEVPTFDVIGGGDLYVLHNGELIQGSWSRSSQADGYRFVTSDGSSLAIPAGALYLGVVPDSASIGFGS